MKKEILVVLISLIALFQFEAYPQKLQENLINAIGERIDGPANVRDTMNSRQILFSLYDNVLVECTAENSGWYTVGLKIRLDSAQFSRFDLQRGDTLFNTVGTIVGIVYNQTPIKFADKGKGIPTGFIVGYTTKNNIRPKSIIENALTEITLSNGNTVSLDVLAPLINSFQMQPCSSTCMGCKKGEWFYYEDNLIDDISPRDRITLLVENRMLIGVVHSRRIEFKNCKTYELIRGHKFTPIAKLSDDRIDSIIKERINWYNSID